MKALLAFASLSVTVWAQTNINGSRTVKGNLRVQGTTATIQSGSSLPSQCAPGPPPDVYIRTTDNTYHYCTAANTWTMIAGGGGGASGTVIPAANAIPKSGADGKLNTGWMPLVRGDSGSGGAAGLVPAPSAGDGGSGRFLRADGNWAIPPSAPGTLPNQAGASGKLLSTNGDVADWRDVGTGFVVDSMAVRIDSASVPMLDGANVHTGTNTFNGSINGTGLLDGSGMTVQFRNYKLQLAAAPQAPTGGNLAVYADQTTGKLACRDSSGANCMPSSGALKMPVPVARCEAGTGRISLSTAASNAPTAACVSSGPAVSAVAQFAAQPASAQSVHDHFTLPDDWTGAVDLKIKWRSSATTNSVTWEVRTACVAGDGDIANPTFNTASTASQAPSATANGLTVTTVSNITTTGCAGGRELFWQLSRATNDTTAAAADLVGLEFSIRRAW